MRLFIAEKHSVGRAIAQTLGGRTEEHDGYARVGDDLITWAQGHLVDLATPDEYRDRGWDRWSLDTLPIDPTPYWQWDVSKGAARQYGIVAGLLRRRDVDLLVDACDPDREGEAIFRRIIAHAGVDKPAMRLWVASLEPDAIRDAIQDMKPESEYQGLADSAMIRAKADWLMGMNASRAYSLVYNTRFAVGRVQTPTLALIVERDRRIAGHVAQPYWRITAPMGGWRLTSGRIDERGRAENLLQAVNAPDFAFGIYKVDRHRQHDAPPHLYDLTSLQKDMSRLHGLTAARTLAALQTLYEQRLTTYPRTDSQYITRADLDTLRKLTTGERLAEGFIPAGARPEEPRLELTVHDSKVAGHTAILPTMTADAAALDGLDEDQRLVLTRVVRRMWEAVGDDYVHDVTAVTANIADEWAERHAWPRPVPDEEQVWFTSRSDQPISQGWRAVDRDEQREEHDNDDDGNDTDGTIPASLIAGVPLPPSPSGGATMTEGRTKPPKPYTEATLLSAMEHASRLVDDKELKAALDDDESHSGGLGTPATRADVIEKLIRSAYVERRGRQLRSTPQGQALIDVVSPQLKDVALTASMERRLSDVEHGHADPVEVENEFRALASNIPADARDTVRQEHVRTDKPAAETFGDCPRCGAPVTRSGKVWQCSTNKREKQADGSWRTTGGCGWRAFPTIAGKTISESAMRRLLAGQKVTLKGFTSKRGSKFDATIRIDKDRGVSFDFGNNHRKERQ